MNTVSFCLWFRFLECFSKFSLFNEGGFAGLMGSFALPTQTFAGFAPFFALRLFLSCIPVSLSLGIALFIRPIAVFRLAIAVLPIAIAVFTGCIAENMPSIAN